MGSNTPELRSKINSPFPAFQSLLAIAFLSLALISGCSPLYVLRAAYEEGKILWRREPIVDLLEKPDLDREEREKLRLVLAVRDYARDTLKFRVGGSYASYSYVDREDLSYVLMAAPKTSLRPYTWWFLFVGRVPYKGFFSEEAARAEAEGFEGEGYDVYVRTTPAFSTLGWFDDPLLAHLLRYDEVTLAQIVFHELFHNTLFLSGGLDFNESVANFVGNRAAIQFFRDRYGEDSPQLQKAQRAWQEELEFSRFIVRVGRSLEDLYAADLALGEKLRLREEIFQKSKQDWARRIADRPSHRFRGYAEQKVNNAVIAHYLLYVRELDLFESLYEARGGDLEGTVASIEKSVRHRSDPFEAVRQLLASPGH